MPRGGIDIRDKKSPALREINIREKVERSVRQDKGLLVDLSGSGIPDVTGLKIGTEDVGSLNPGLFRDVSQTGQRGPLGRFFERLGGAIAYLLEGAGAFLAIPYGMSFTGNWDGGMDDPVQRGRITRSLDGFFTRVVIFKGELVRIPRFIDEKWAASEANLEKAKKVGWRIAEYEGERYLIPDSLFFRYSIGTDYQYMRTAFPEHTQDVDVEGTPFQKLSDAILYSNGLDNAQSMEGIGEVVYPSELSSYLARPDGIEMALAEGWVMVRLITEPGRYYFLSPEMVVKDDNHSIDRISAGVLEELRGDGLIWYRTGNYNLTEKDSSRPSFGRFLFERRSHLPHWPDLEVQGIRYGSEGILEPLDLSSPEYKWLDNYPPLKDWLSRHVMFLEHFDIVRIKYFLDAWGTNPGVSNVELYLRDIQGVLGEIILRPSFIRYYQEKFGDDTSYLPFFAPQISSGDVHERSDFMVVYQDGKTFYVVATGEVAPAGDSGNISEQNRKSLLAYAEKGLLIMDPRLERALQVSPGDVIIDGDQPPEFLQFRYDPSSMQDVMGPLRQLLVFSSEIDMFDQRVQESLCRDFLTSMERIKSGILYVITHDFEGSAEGLRTTDFKRELHVVSPDGLEMTGLRLVFNFARLWLVTEHPDIVFNSLAEAVNILGGFRGVNSIIQRELFGKNGREVEILSSYDEIVRAMRFVVEEHLGGDASRLPSLAYIQKDYTVDEVGTSMRVGRLYAHYAKLRWARDHQGENVSARDAIEKIGGYAVLGDMILEEHFGLTSKEADILSSYDELVKAIQYVVENEFDGDHSRLLLRKFKENKHKVDDDGTEMSGLQLVNHFARLWWQKEHGEVNVTVNKAKEEIGGFSAVAVLLRQEIFGAKTRENEILSSYDAMVKAIRYVVEHELEGDHTKIGRSVFMSGRHKVDEFGTTMTGHQILRNFARLKWAVDHGGETILTEEAVKKMGGWRVTIDAVQSDLFGKQTRETAIVSSYSEIVKALAYVVNKELKGDYEQLRYPKIQRSKHKVDDKGTEMTVLQLLHNFAKLHWAREHQGEILPVDESLRALGGIPGVLEIVNKEVFGDQTRERHILSSYDEMMGAIRYILEKHFAGEVDRIRSNEFQRNLHEVDEFGTMFTGLRLLYNIGRILWEREHGEGVLTVVEAAKNLGGISGIIDRIIDELR